MYIADVFEFLDDLRASGVTFDAEPYVEDAFGLSKDEARDAVHEWMRERAL